MNAKALAEGLLNFKALVERRKAAA
jgi:hypothetical protein